MRATVQCEERRRPTCQTRLLARPAVFRRLSFSTTLSSARLTREARWTSGCSCGWRGLSAATSSVYASPERPIALEQWQWTTSHLSPRGRREHAVVIGRRVA
jgi:hypothetical protein